MTVLVGNCLCHSYGRQGFILTSRRDLILASRQDLILASRQDFILASRQDLASDVPRSSQKTSKSAAINCFAGAALVAGGHPTCLETFNVSPLVFEAHGIMVMSHSDET